MLSLASVTNWRVIRIKERVTHGMMYATGMYTTTTTTTSTSILIHVFYL